MRSFELGRVALLGCVIAATPACGDSEGPTGGAPDGGSPTADAGATGPDAGGTAPDAAAGDFTALIGRDWTLPAGTERYRCTRLTVSEDLYIRSFRAISPVGTHHTVLSVNDSSAAADGDYDCNANALAHSMLFASGVGTDDLTFPEGVAIRVRAGQQLDLNLHLFNVSDAAISGYSGTSVELLSADEVVHEAEFVFGGTFNIILPNSPGAEQTVGGGCVFTADATVTAIWPHMHQVGRHMKVVHEASGGDAVLHDAAFDFNEQVNWPIAATEVKAGERLDIECTYLNDTGRTIIFGDSSTSEMCFAGLYRYPATGAGLFDCVE